MRDRLYGYPRGEAPKRGELRPVVYLPTWTEWGVMPQRPQYILEAFADAGHDVWFVDPRLSSAKDVDERIRLVPSLAAVPPRDVIIYCHFAPLTSVMGRFERPAVVYDISDDLSIYDADEKSLPEERRVRHHHGPLVKDADAVIVSNSVLRSRHGVEREDLLLVENGVDLDRFSPEGAIAPELADKGQVVGYHGAVAQWFDFDLMFALAAQATELEFVMVGPVDPRVADRLGELSRYGNVTHIPAQPGERIPDYVRGFDVGLIPFVVNEMTEGVTPLKMYEYLACGVPVVATPLPACVEHPSVSVAGDSPGFLTHIEEAMGAGPESNQKLRARAEEASWRRRLVPLLNRLDDLGLRTV